jgi:hypothetical protein
LLPRLLSTHFGSGGAGKSFMTHYCPACRLRLPVMKDFSARSTLRAHCYLASCRVTLGLWRGKSFMTHYCPACRLRLPGMKDFSARSTLRAHCYLASTTSPCALGSRSAATLFPGHFNILESRRRTSRESQSSRGASFGPGPSLPTELHRAFIYVRTPQLLTLASPSALLRGNSCRACPQTPWRPSIQERGSQYFSDQPRIRGRLNPRNARPRSCALPFDLDVRDHGGSHVALAPFKFRRRSAPERHSKRRAS